MSGPCSCQTRYVFTAHGTKHTRRMPGHSTILYCPPSGTQALGEPLSSHGAPQRWHWPADALRGATLRGACKVAGRAPQEETEHL